MNIINQMIKYVYFLTKHIFKYYFISISEKYTGPMKVATESLLK